MTWRPEPGGAPQDGAAESPTDQFDHLLWRVEQGSGSAGRQLEALILGTTMADAKTSATTQHSPSGRAPALDPAEMLDRLALSAADGSPHSIDLLLGVIVAGNLAGPAVGRVVPAGVAGDDIVQEVLVAVSRSIHRFRRESRFTTWLYAVARNVAISHLRRMRPTVAFDTELPPAATGTRRLSSVVAERDAVHTAIASLPSSLRPVVYLRDVCGLSYAEIAARQGLTVTTVRSRLSRGRSLLAGRLG